MRCCSFFACSFLAIALGCSDSDGGGGGTPSPAPAGLNRPPVTRPDYATTDEGRPVSIDVTANDSDPDGDIFTVSAVTDGASGTARLEPTGLVTYTPAGDFNGDDAFTYTAVDFRGNRAEGQVFVTVSPVNDPPAALDDQASTDENAAVVIDVLANDTDVDGDTLRIAAVGDASHGTVTVLPDETLLYAPADRFWGVDGFTYTVEDEGGAEDQASVVITVNRVNEPPIVDIAVGLAGTTVSRGGVLPVTLTALDPEDPVDMELYADGDGDFSTAADQTLLLGGIRVAGPAPFTARVSTAGVNPGAFRLIVVASDGVNAPVIAVSSEELVLSNVAWARSAGSSDRDAARAIAALPDGSILAAGSFSGDAVFGLGEAAETLLASKGFTDIFVAKYNQDGSLAWARSAGGSLEDEALGIAAQPDGSFVLAGSFEKSAAFDAGNSALVQLTARAGSRDLFLARFRPDGIAAWALSAGGDEDDAATAVALHEDGSASICGWFEESATFGAGQAGETTLEAGKPISYVDAFVARYDLDGLLRWAVRIGGERADRARSVAALPGGAVAVTGFFGSTVAAIEKSTPGLDLLNVASRDFFLVCLDSDGGLRWARNGGDDGAQPDAFAEGTALAACADGGLLAAGNFARRVTFNAWWDDPLTLDGLAGGASQDVFLVRYAADGSVLWARAAGGPEEDEACGVASLPGGSSIVTGGFRASGVFGAGEANPVVLDAAGGSDIFLARYDPDGGVVWASRAGGAAQSDVGIAAAPLEDESCVAAGSFGGRAVFGPGDDLETTVVAAGGDLDREDVFVARWNADGAF
ncbi:MAG: tandem-95 repeat protein [Planctomycetes bacterium]|nr:tandem-95 repeat protein [Planctomycetota bacterium]